MEGEAPEVVGRLGRAARDRPARLPRPVLARPALVGARPAIVPLPVEAAVPVRVAGLCVADPLPAADGDGCCCGAAAAGAPVAAVVGRGRAGGAGLVLTPPMVAVVPEVAPGGLGGGGRARLALGLGLLGGAGDEAPILLKKSSEEGTLGVVIFQFKDGEIAT